MIPPTMGMSSQFYRSDKVFLEIPQLDCVVLKLLLYKLHYWSMTYSVAELRDCDTVVALFEKVSVF